ncbi:hypothetical protein QBC45DRAFT_338731, partial [Copromyces sp. CBS 386.78]
KVTILKRFARGEGTCSGDYRWMPRETGKLCDPCRIKAVHRREAARSRRLAAAAAVEAAAAVKAAAAARAAAAMVGDNGQPAALAESVASEPEM